jgi:hypothetical protein
MAIIRALRDSMDCDRFSWIMHIRVGPGEPFCNGRPLMAALNARPLRWQALKNQAVKTRDV